MSARDDLFAELVSYMMDNDWAVTDLQCEAAANELIDAFAHELAEEIREHAKGVTRPGTPGHAGLMTGANLIDPHKE